MLLNFSPRVIIEFGRYGLFWWMYEWKSLRRRILDGRAWVEDDVRQEGLIFTLFCQPVYLKSLVSYSSFLLSNVCLGDCVVSCRALVVHSILLCSMDVIPSSLCLFVIVFYLFLESLSIALKCNLFFLAQFNEALR